MPDLVRRYTVRDLDEFPNDGKKYELIRGELFVSPTPSVIHEMIRMGVVRQLMPYLEALGLGEALLAGPADISWDDGTELVEEWHSGDERPLILADTLRWQVTPDAPGCSIEIASLFRGLPPAP